MQKTTAVSFLFAIITALLSSSILHTTHIKADLFNKKLFKDKNIQTPKKTSSKLKRFAIGSFFITAAIGYYYKNSIKEIILLIQNLYNNNHEIASLSDENQTAPNLLIENERLIKNERIAQLKNNYQSALAILEALRELLKKETERKKKAHCYRDSNIDYWRNRTSIEKNIHKLTLEIEAQTLHVENLRIELDGFA